MATSLIHRVYWKSPYAVKCALASAHAWWLDVHRYGEDYERLCEEIVARESWPAGRFAEYQDAQLRGVVHLAATHVPYYRRVFAERGIDADDIRGVADLRRLPILEKAPVREDPKQFLEESRPRRELRCQDTSGTTGTPIRLYRDRRLAATAFAYQDARCYRVAGVRRRENRSVCLGGRLVAPPDAGTPPFWVHNRRWRQLYMSSYHLAPRWVGDYVAKLREFGGEYIEGYPSSLYAVAAWMLDNGVEPVPFRAAFTMAEKLFDHQREAIARAFACRTFAQYGCGEQAVFAAECRRGTLHLSPEVGIVEVLDENDQPVAPGETGQFVCTSLVNRVQPFIRYRLGDVGALGAEPCPCGSPLPTLARVEGRADAVLITRDGRRIGRLDPVFKGADGIAEAQIVQDDYDRFRIRVVPAGGYTDADAETLRANLAERVGSGARIDVEPVERIERTPAGKFPAVVCNLPDRERRGRQQDRT